MTEMLVTEKPAEHEGHESRGRPAPSPETRFDKALATYMTRRTELDALPEDCPQEEDDRYYQAMIAAEKALFATAPQTVADVRALAEIAFEDLDSLPGEELIGPILAGLRKVDRNAPSRTFRPDWWLTRFEYHGGGWIDRRGEISLLTPTPANDALKGLLWELETRGGREAVKVRILARSETVSVPANEGSVSLEWQELRRRFEIEAARMEANNATPYTGTFDDPQCEKAEALTAEISDAYDDAADGLLLYPAPDAAALRYKLALLAGERFAWAHHPRAGEFAKAVDADAARLLSGE